MKSKVLKTNIVLLSSKFNFQKSKEITQISISTVDKITINDVSNDMFVLIVSRTLEFEPTKETHLEVVFEVTVGTSDKETVDSVVRSINEGSSLLGNVFARASLLISQITSASAFGPIITAPMYDAKNITIETKI